LVRTSRDESVELSEGALDKIKLAAQSIISSQDDIGFTEQQDRLAADMISENDVSMLQHTQETEMLASGSDELDLAFSNGPISIGDGSFGLNGENALIGCDEELSDVAGVPPRALLESGDFELYDADRCPNEEEVEIDLEEKPKDKSLKIGMSNDFEIEF